MKIPLDPSISINEQLLKDIFKDCSDVVFHSSSMPIVQASNACMFVRITY
ncbi:hypothetical protein [Paenibacillus sp. CF384]|nr:hypothetical protein [Paenibacillus sp. CF384]SDW61101.1 hypothetical protein SAMN05518855_1003304 [Paenibacillus sp. CF384]